jgi:hypothetical protein
LHNLYAARHGSNEAFLLKNSNDNTLSGNIDLIAAVTDRMNRAAYQHAIYAAFWSLERLHQDGTTSPVEQNEVFRFDTLPFKGERVQLSPIIYRDSISTSSGKIQANGNSGPRFFLVNLTSGSVSGGYSADHCLKTSNYPSGRYILNVEIQDFSGNSRKQSFKINIKN